jgi:hypothetical protein
MQVLQEQKPAPESTGAGVFAVASSGDGLIERLHEPGEAAQPLPAGAQAICVAEQGLFLRSAAGLIRFTICGRRKQADPAHRDLLVRPRLRGGGIDPKRNMHVVAHDRIGIDADGKDLGQREQPLIDPVPPMLVGCSVIRINPAQPSSANTAGDAVIEAGGVRIDKEAAGSGHAHSVTSGHRVVCRKFPTRGVGLFYNLGYPRCQATCCQVRESIFLLWTSRVEVQCCWLPRQDCCAEVMIQNEDGKR